MLSDGDVLHSLEECAAFELTLSATKQIQLLLRHGDHSSSAFVSSLFNAIDVTSVDLGCHHTLTCRSGGDTIRDIFVNLCFKA